MDLSERCHRPEKMDEPGVPVALMTEALRDLDAINTWLGGHSASLALLGRRLRVAGQPARLLDVGAGGAGTARYLHRWAKRNRIDLQITLLDIHSAVCRVAAGNTRRHRGVHLVQADAFRLPFGAGTFHYAHSALFLHHFSDPEIVRLLTEMRRVASEGVVLNDLHRHIVAYQAIRSLGRLFIRSPIVRNDAPLSVRRGFRAEDLDGWRQVESLSGLGYRRRWPFRWAAWIFADGGTPERSASRV